MVLRPDEFTDAARQVLHESQQIVQRYLHSQWDAEHVLMALLEQQQGVPADVLAEIGADILSCASAFTPYWSRRPSRANHPTRYTRPRA